MENPHDPPQEHQLPLEDTALQTPRHYGGLRRLPYFGLTFIWVFGLSIVADISGTNITAIQNEFLIAIWWVIYVSILWYYRLKNIGWSPWWILPALIPPFNIVLGILCLFIPEGYADSKKLDTAGKIGISIIKIGISIIILIIFIVGVSAFL